MTPARGSLLGGRNQAPLTDAQVRRVANVFLAMEPSVNARYERDAKTVFRVARDEQNSEYGEVVFGPDIYPGQSVADPNSALSINAAVAHELAHYHRWADLRALNESEMEDLDEALTSLDAILRYRRHLSEQDVNQLIQDAMQRMRLHLARSEIVETDGMSPLGSSAQD